MDSSFTYFSKIKGPVPTGLRFMSEGAPDLSNCAAYSAERIDAGGAARFDRKTALGDLSVKRTIYGLNRSGSSIFSTRYALRNGISRLRMRSKVKTTSSPLNSRLGINQGVT